MSLSQTAAARCNHAEKAAQALELRKMGLTFRKIGAQMGVSEAYAHELVTKELTRLSKERAESAEHVMRLELDRLDDLYERARHRAEYDPEGRALSNCLRIMERRAKLLGLDAPTRVEQTGENTLEIKLPDGWDKETKGDE